MSHVIIANRRNTRRLKNTRILENTLKYVHNMHEAYSMLRVLCSIVWSPYLINSFRHISNIPTSVTDFIKTDHSKAI